MKQLALAAAALALLGGSAAAPAQPPAAAPFIHPGAVNGRAELERVRRDIERCPAEWRPTGRYAPLLALATPYDGTAAPGNTRADQEAAKADARKAYANALAWYYTGEAHHAATAVRIFDVWATGFAGYPVTPGVSGQSQLNAGWVGALLGSAAEVLRGFPGWSAAQQATVRAMFETRFYPALHQESTWNGNVDLTQIDALMNIAVFNENAAWLAEAKARLKRRNPRYFFLPGDVGAGHDGSDPSWFQPTRWTAGLTQETCRTNAQPPNDNGHHAQFAIASALRAAEVAWNQGDASVYDDNQTRYIAAMELLATQVRTGDMQGVCQDPVTTRNLFDTWAIGYNHYHHRRGLALPATQRLLEAPPPRALQSDWNIFHESLTHGRPGSPGSPCTPGTPAPSGPSRPAPPKPTHLP